MSSTIKNHYFSTKATENLVTPITLEAENRRMIYGIVQDIHNQVLPDAMVCLFEVGENSPLKFIAHTFTDGTGSYILGPLEADTSYVLKVWSKTLGHKPYLSETFPLNSPSVEEEQGKSLPFDGPTKAKDKKEVLPKNSKNDFDLSEYENMKTFYNKQNLKRKD